MKSYDNFFLPIDNMDAAKDFYGKTLGLKLKFDFQDIGMSAFSVGTEEAVTDFYRFSRNQVIFPARVAADDAANITGSG